MKNKKINFKNILAYIQGKLRYKLYYSNFAFLIRPHIREQIEVRINSMDRECYNSGQCKLCGCETTALQMANKACDKPCHPKMFTKSEWKKIQNRAQLYDKSTWRWWHLIKGINIFYGDIYKSYEDMIDKQPKPQSKLEESDIELFKTCEADIHVVIEEQDLSKGILGRVALAPNNNCE